MDAKLRNRKGARSSKDVPEDVLRLLNIGQIETVNLMESLAMNMQELYQTIFIEHDFNAPNWGDFQTLGWLKKMKIMPEHVYQQTGYQYFDLLANHKSDMARCWASGLCAYDRDLSFKERLARIKLFADDPHFNVREMAWIYLRNHVSDNLDEALAFFENWVLDDSANIRRFAIEVTRPRGVWCAHIQALKDNPSKGLKLLELLKSDPSKYVQDSVANWLNDASKTQGAWVGNVCADWLSQSSSKATQYICKRAQRTRRKFELINGS